MVVELVKPIKPKRLAIDEVRQNILKVLQDEGRIIIREFNKTTRTWKGSKPKFEALTDLSGGEAVVIVGPTGSEKAVLKWLWIDEGTRRHPITAKRAPFLKFREGFSPKTLPNKLASFPSGTFGPWVSKKTVDHPGTEPRNFSKLVVRRRRKKLTNNLIKAARI